MSGEFQATTGEIYLIGDDGYVIKGGKKYPVAKLVEAGHGVILQNSVKTEEPRKETAQKPQAKPKEKTETGEKTIGDAAKDVATAILNSPQVIGEGLKRNPKVVLAKATASSLAPNTYSAIKEGRYLPGIPVGVGMDVAQMALSPLKVLGTTAKVLGVNHRLVNPITKTASQVKNTGRNALREAIIGAGDNLAWEAASDALDDRSHGASDYLLSGGIGGGLGIPTGILQARRQARNMNEYSKALAAKNHNQEQKENIRNFQNNTESDLESFSKFINEGHPFSTTTGHYNRAKNKREKIGDEMGNYLNSQEANTPMEKATLSDFQEILSEHLYNDNSGNLSGTEKDLVLKNFYEDALDMLKSNSPRLKKYLEEHSKKVLGHPRSYLDNQNFTDLAMERYDLSPNELDMLREVFSHKTTLTIPSKPGYVRAGADNRNANEYSKMFKSEMARRPEANVIRDYNNKWSTAKNHEELMTRVLDKQGFGGITGKHYPYLEINPEINPTIIGNKPLMYRNMANQTIDGIRGLASIPDEDEETIKMEIAGILKDAEKLGLKTEKEITGYVYSRLGNKQPGAAGPVLYSEQKRGEK